MYKLRLVLILFTLSWLFTRGIFAEEKSVFIDLLPEDQNIFVGNTFSVNVAIGSTYSNTTFHYLFYGGPLNQLDSIQTKTPDLSSLINYQENQQNCQSLPTFTTDEIGNGYLRSNLAFIPDNKPTGNYQLYVKFFFNDCSSNDELTSDFINFFAYDTSFFFTPTPTLVILTPTINLIKSETQNTSSTLNPTQIPNPTPNQQPLLKSDPKIFGTNNKKDNSLENTISSPILLNDDPNLKTIKTGSKPSNSSKNTVNYINPPKDNKLGFKIFFIFILVSTSFVLYYLCFSKIYFNYKNIFPPEIFQRFKIKPKNIFYLIRVFWQKLSIFNKSKNFLNLLLFYLIKYLRKIFIFLKNCSQIIKSHIKLPRKIKRFLIHRKLHLLIFIFFLLKIFTKSSLAGSTLLTTNQSWVVPTGSNFLTVEAWGGGGGGGGLVADRTTGHGAGGAGGQYAKNYIPVNHGVTCVVVIGSGGIGTAGSGANGGDTSLSIGSTVFVRAKGGAGGQSYDAGYQPGIGSFSGGVGKIIYRGGSGTAGATGVTSSGGGGGGAGSTASGYDANGMFRGVGTSEYGGAGGMGRESTGAGTANGNPGGVYGGGGGGCGCNSANKTIDYLGGSGGAGLMRITYTYNNSPTIPTLIVPLTNAISVSTLPTFQSVSTDADNDYLKYKIQLCTNSSMSVGCTTFDQVFNNLGWSGQNILDFNNTTNYSVGNSGITVFSGLLSNDSFPDLIVTDFSVGSTSVIFLLNDGSGNFNTQTKYTSGIQPRYSEITDINFDGYQDFVVTNVGSSYFSVFINNGDSTFQNKVDYSTNGYIRYVDSGNLNGDSFPDLVFSNIGASSIQVYLNNGNGTFNAKTDYLSDNDVRQNAVADINNDNYSDIIATDDVSDTVKILNNNGSGVFSIGSSYSTGTDPLSLDVGYLNNDNYLDLVVTNWGSTNTVVFLNQGNGTFYSGTNYDTKSLNNTYIKIGKINSDNYFDFVVTNTSDNKIYLFLNNGDGSFTAGDSYSTNAIPYSVSIDDFNQDSQNDLVSSSFGSDQFLVSMSNPIYSSGTTASYTLPSKLSSGTTYYWRSYAIDPSGLNTWSSTQDTPFSFTTTGGSSNQSPSTPSTPYINNIAAQSGQVSPVYGLTDHTPAFSAIFDDPNTSDTASAYQIQIGTDSDWITAETWDSNKTSISGTCNENSRCSDVIYSGSNSLLDSTTYYWRLKFWDNSDVGSSWSDTQQFSMNSPPSVSNVVVNNNNSINLTENSSIGISWTATITDGDSYSNLASSTGKIYRSGVGSNCTPDNNNCYTSTCSFSDCSSNSCIATCTANILYFAQPTDNGDYTSEYWQGTIDATDNYSEASSSTSSSTTVEVNSLSAFSIGSSLVYGEVFAGSDTGSSNTVTNITNTGNSLINLEITGDYMCTDYPSCTGSSIEPKYQQYKTNNFSYGVGDTLSLSPQAVNIGLSKPTQSPSNSSKNIYWGIGIPSSKTTGNYQGSITILVY